MKKWIIWSVVFLHFTYGLSLILSNTPLDTSTLHWMIYSFGSFQSGIIFIFSSMLMCFSVILKSVVLKNKKTGFFGIICAVPQQLLLLESANRAILCIYAGSFADGVIRPRMFIFVDQLPAMLLAFFHTVALIDWSTGGKLWKRRQFH